MAKQRYINTKFWSDNFVSDLNPLDKYLFLYFLTNEHTNICGIYEVPLKAIAFETGLELETLKKMLKRLTNKVYYIDGWVYIKNFAKHQSFNESIKKGIESAKLTIPKEIMAKINKIDQEGDSLGTASPQDPTYLNPNLNLNSNREAKAETSSAVPQIIKLFEEINPNYEEWYRNTTQRKAISVLLDRVGFEKLERIIKALPSITSQKAAPRITSPFELKRDWAKLGIFINQQKGAKKEILI